MSVEKIAEGLTDFGLTINQAKIYGALLNLHVSTVGQLAKASSVRREDVYRILPTLERLGLVERILDAPVKLRALPLEQALSTLIEMEQRTAKQKLSTLQSRKETFLRDFARASPARAGLDEEYQFTMLTKRERVYAKLLNMLSNAKKTFSLVASEDEFVKLILDYSRELRAALARGVQIRVLLEFHADHTTVLDLVKSERLGRTSRKGGRLSVRNSDQNLSHYALVDHTESLLSTTKIPAPEETPYLWTNNLSLVGLMSSNFDEAWRDSIAVDDVHTATVSEKLAGFMTELKPRDHVVFTYESPEAKHYVLFTYLKAGLEKGEAAVYVASEESRDSIRSRMKDFGISVAEHESSGQLQVLGYTDIYIVEGKADIKGIANRWRQIYEIALVKGFAGLRVTGEMACFFQHNLTDELVEYETALHRVLDVPMTAICAYNTKLIAKLSDPIDFYNKIVKAHAFVLFAGIDAQLGRLELRTG